MHIKYINASSEMSSKHQTTSASPKSWSGEPPILVAAKSTNVSCTHPKNREPCLGMSCRLASIMTSSGNSSGKWHFEFSNGLCFIAFCCFTSTIISTPDFCSNSSDGNHDHSRWVLRILQSMLARPAAAHRFGMLQESTIGPDLVHESTASSLVRFQTQ